MSRSLRDIIEWALYMDGDKPRPTPIELGQQTRDTPPSPDGAGTWTLGLSRYGVPINGRAANGGYFTYWLWHRRHPIRSLLSIPRTIRAARAMCDRNEILL